MTLGHDVVKEAKVLDGLADNALCQAALGYAARGWLVLPLHTPIGDGGCSCGKARCPSPGKHPRTPNGVNDATTDEATIKDWWERWLDANVGIATGAESGLVFLDVDPRHGGDESLHQLRNKYGDLPDTIESLTSGGGRHVGFLHPGDGTIIRNKARLAGLPGLDLRGDQGYIVAPPSRHETGHLYAWELSSHPDDVSPAPMPPWLMELAAAHSRKNGHMPVEPAQQIIVKGARNTTLTSLAGSMRLRGMDEAVIFSVLRAVNGEQCAPPLDENEVKAIAKSVARYEPGHNSHNPPQNLTSDICTPPSEVKLKRVNAGDLQQRAIKGDIPPLERLPFLGQKQGSPFIRGWSHMVAGYPKTGKTELLSRVMGEWSDPGLRVAYYTEEPQSVWDARLPQLPQGFDNVDLVFALGANAKDILQDIEHGDDDVVVIDTIRLLRLKDENDNAEINRVLTPFIAACRQGEKTLVVAHHTRKGSGKHGEAAAGGHASLGIVDVALELQRDEQVTGRRVVRGWGRILEVPQLVYEKQEDGLMKLLGDPQELSLQNVKERILECLDAEWEATKKIREALDDPKPSIDQISNALRDLAADGSVERDPPLSEGKQKGKTYRWRRPHLTSDTKRRVIGGEVLPRNSDVLAPAPSTMESPSRKPISLGPKMPGLG